MKHVAAGVSVLDIQSVHLCDQIASSGRLLSSSTPPSRHSWFAPKPEVYARHAISTLGVSNRTTGYWPHTLQVSTKYVIGTLSEFASSLVQHCFFFLYGDLSLSAVSLHSMD